VVVDHHRPQVDATAHLLDGLLLGAGQGHMKTKKGQGHMKTKKGQGHMKTKKGRGHMKTKKGRGHMKTKKGRGHMKTKKNYYSFLFKSGDYFRTSRMLEDKYPTLFWGCGCGKNGYDVGFHCTAAQVRQISNYISRNLPKAKMCPVEV